MIDILKLRLTEYALYYAWCGSRKMYQLLLSGVIPQPTHSVICLLDVNILMAGRKKDTFLGRNNYLELWNSVVYVTEWSNANEGIWSIFVDSTTIKTQVRNKWQKPCKARLTYTNFVTICFHDSIILISLICGNCIFLLPPWVIKIPTVSDKYGSWSSRPNYVLSPSEHWTISSYSTIY